MLQKAREPFKPPFLKGALRECDGLLSEVWINTVQHSEELICNIFRRPKGEEGIAIQFRGILDSINPYLG